MKHHLGPRATLLPLALALVALVALPASSAFAGKLMATGHDVDGHSNSGGQEHFFETAMAYVKGGSTAPVLLLDCSGVLTDSYEFVFPGAPYTAKCPSLPADNFASEPLTTASYSAIVVGSSCFDSINQSGDCNGNPGSLPDSDAIFARKGDIEAYFNAGGGIFVMSGENNGDGDPTTGPDTYYSFLPLPVGGIQVTPPFTLTPEGQALGFHDATNDIPAGTIDDDINCCETHNSFAEPTNPLIKVAERDCGPSGAPCEFNKTLRTADGAAETLFADGLIIGGQLVSGQQAAAVAATPAKPAAVKPSASSSASGPKSCVTKSARVRVSGKNIASVTYSLNGKKIKTAKGNKTSVTINAKGLKSGVHRVAAKVSYTSATGAKSQTRRITFSRCARKAARPKFTG